ncbi:hypothetical protein HOE31_02885 [bacterium]|jgi:hypothetical protein|nr:hypothetical protein [bacterium]MBT4496061.1 hypothetical protein [bacterium]MBT4764010.1 hypothetical protein [bacterium]MBT5401382.1 hypothetical protein [bacterium]MBT5942659.1 hypothetical protein [bacterium]
MLNKTVQNFINLIKKSDLKNYYVGEKLSRIKVDSFASKIAFIYEKIRNAIDYKEEHLLRKNAIDRVLWRRLNLKFSTDNIGNSLIKELIRAGYLENNLIPASKSEEVESIINKYIQIIELGSIKRRTTAGVKMFKWLVSICACEVEEALAPPLESKALVEFAYFSIGKEVKIIDKKLSDKEKQLQILIALNRSLVKSDKAMLNYYVWKYYNPNWRNATKNDVMQVAKKINTLKKVINEQLTYYLSERLLRVFRKYAVVFQVMKEIIIKHPKEAEAIFNNPEDLEFHVRTTCEKMYKKAKTKLRRSIFRVIIYIFLTKMLLVLLLELPYEKYVAESVIMLPLIVNAVFPPFLMFLIGLFIWVPSKKNTKRINYVAQVLVNKGQLKSTEGVGGVVKRSPFNSAVFIILYLILFSLSFGGILMVLSKLQFTWVSMVIFLLFLSLVSFFGIKLRMGVRELVIIDKKENIFASLLNLISLPFLRAGYWLSVKFQKINLLVFFFDFIIEAPFKIFIEVIEDWIAYLKEKKEEIYNQQQE